MAALHPDSTRLINAVRSNEIDTVNHLLARGVSPNFQVGGGWTPLLSASQRGHTAIVRALLEHGAEVDAALPNGGTSLIYASSRGHTAIVRALLEHGADTNAVITKTKFSSLWQAASNGHYDILVDLVEYGAGINAQDWIGVTPLFIACQEGREVCVAALLDSGADMEMARSDNGERPLGAATRKGHKEVVELLLRRGARINQGDKEGKTPLMQAAQEGHDGCIGVLLQHGAQPDLQENNGMTALEIAVEQKLTETSILLLPHTTITGDRGESILYWIGRKGMQEVATQFLHKLKNSDNKDKSGKLTTADEGSNLKILESGLRGASKFGESGIAQMILNEVQEEKEKEKLCQQVIKLALESDQEPVVKVVMQHLSNISNDLIDLAIKRRVPGVIDTLKNSSRDDKISKRLEVYTSKSVMKKAEQQMKMIASSNNILDKVPKSVELLYFNFNKAYVDILTDGAVQIDTAISSLRAPEVHLKSCNKGTCHQNQICCLFIESKKVIDDILDKLGREIDIFIDTYGTLVGSIKENSRVGRPDEIDTLVQLSNALVDNFTFDESTQTVTVNFSNNRREMLEPYTMGPNNEFNGKKFYDDYIEAVFNILENYVIPSDCPLSRQYLQISLNYDPCIKCVDIKFGQPTFLRCKHSDRNEPTLCHSKVGLVLHFGWRKPTGQFIHKIDIDLTCPKVPTRNKCNGQIGKIQSFLRTTKYMGWLDEYNKLMETIPSSLHLTDPSTIWLVQMRKINNDVVIARQMVPYMRDETLKGAKLDLYILLKILKNITDSEAKSFSIKYALDYVFVNTIPEREKIGEAAIKIMDFKTLRGKWGGLHPDLRALGYTGVDLKSLLEGNIRLIRNESIQSDATGGASTSVQNKPGQSIQDFTKEVEEFKQAIIMDNQEFRQVVTMEDDKSLLEVKTSLLEINNKIKNSLTEKLAIIDAELLKRQ